MKEMSVRVAKRRFPGYVYLGSRERISEIPPNLRKFYIKIGGRYYDFTRYFELVKGWSRY